MAALSRDFRRDQVQRVRHGLAVGPEGPRLRLERMEKGSIRQTLLASHESQHTFDGGASASLYFDGLADHRRPVSCSC